MAATVDCWFDYASPFAYLGTTQIERVAKAAGAQVRFRPFLLGALFKAIGTPVVPLYAMPEAKQRYYRLELERWATRWRVPFRFSTRFPVRSVDALRVTLLAPEPRRPALVAAIMRATWVEDRDLADPEVIRAACVEADVEPGLVERQADARQRLVYETAEAQRLGVPGAPTFVVGSELFWGQDRLELVADALAGVVAPPLELVP
ncbi:MAG: 2-hydroxychromene-2-carboxylate isomerase [Sandaracinaceae bacterium]